MPRSEALVVNRLEIVFTLSDGSTRTMITKVQERKKAEQKFEDAISAGETAVIATSTPAASISKNVMRI